VNLMSQAVSDQPVPAGYINKVEGRAWVDEMSRRLMSRITDPREREDFLATVHYEAMRAGLDPQLVLGVIQHESAFRKYAISTAGARGYMQVMPFWTKLLGASEQNLFHLRTNLRYGCVILRHYLDIENGDVFRALGRYNGSLGRSEYPDAGDGGDDAQLAVCAGRICADDRADGQGDRGIGIERRAHQARAIKA
jgi:soluble lytic murein transglycosylase-like protein